MDEDNLLSNHRDNLFTSEFLDQPAIPPFLLNSDFLPNENDKLVKINSRKLKDVADNDCKKCTVIDNAYSCAASHQNSEKDPQDKRKGKQKEEVDLLLSKNISDFSKPILSKLEMEDFAKYFKAKRVDLGFTQVDVCDGLEIMFSKNFSQTTICRFEALQLTYNNMCHIFPLLLKWIKEANSAISAGSKEYLTSEKTNKSSQNSQQNSSETITKETIKFRYVGKQRKKRASIDLNMRFTLENLFSNNPRPSTKDLNSISEKLNIDRGVVRVWFCNRRQKEKKNQGPYLNIESSCHDCNLHIDEDEAASLKESLKLFQPVPSSKEEK